MSKKSGIGSLLLGGAIGAGIALLFAPKKGEELRKDLLEKISELCDKLKDIDEDEQTIAKMIRVENIHTSLLSDEGVQEYERIVNAAKQPSKQISFKWITWMGGIAASIALFFIISPLSTPVRQTSETIEIAQCIQQMVNLDMEDIISITATPIDECVWVKTELKDGSTKTFIMNRNKNDKTTTLLAIN